MLGTNQYTIKQSSGEDGRGWGVGGVSGLRRHASLRVAHDGIEECGWYLQIPPTAVYQRRAHPGVLAKHDVVIWAVPHHQQLGAQGHPPAVGNHFEGGRVGLGGNALVVAAYGNAEGVQSGLEY
eukprot:1190356-Prorocentrum_minimum.AAC.1